MKPVNPWPGADLIVSMTIHSGVASEVETEQLIMHPPPPPPPPPHHHHHHHHHHHNYARSVAEIGDHGLPILSVVSSTDQLNVGGFFFSLSSYSDCEFCAFSSSALGITNRSTQYLLFESIRPYLNLMGMPIQVQSSVTKLMRFISSSNFC